ncbi:hypothetical protein FV222_02560 [Methylobacterium sp. WL103]|uniref:hypothetical protein n=1 Tax=Methylobacterium sp. WL103 TaxID=2603891 RepID=UPI0011C7545E|nr:hypothetical protein [Methylobacterium sp. WL103]TXN07326.1 hypothetical protein FV222_02560 [Methylobacterium sp. WL103]
MPNPFGLKFGETPGKKVAQYDVKFYCVPEAHPDFKEYSGQWDPDRGLIQVSGVSKVFENDRFGEHSKTVYERVKSQLSLKYGDHHDGEVLFVGSKNEDRKNFIKGIFDSDRRHSSSWASQHGSDLDSSICRIDLEILSSGIDRSWVEIIYSFTDDEDRGPDEIVGLSSL